MNRNNVKMTSAELLAALNDPNYSDHEERWVSTTVTPEVARALVDRYITARRPLNLRWVAANAERLKHPDPVGGIYEEVRVGTDGKTLAGQHLLYAVLEAGIAVEPVWVVLNCPDPFAGETA